MGICALFGGYTVLSTKALSSLLSTIFLEAFEYWISWALVALLVGTSVMQIKYLNKALMRFQSKVSSSWPTQKRGLTTGTPGGDPDSVCVLLPSW